MSERATIFTRIREALTVATPMPGPHDGEARQPVRLPTPADHYRVLPAVGESFEDRVSLFQKNAAELKADFLLVKDETELAEQLTKLRNAEGWRQIASHSGPLADAACRMLGLPVCRAEAGYDVNAMEKCDAGISECDALIAQTGSVVVTSRSAGGRALSVLPPHHVVMARLDQLVPGLPDALALLKKKYGSSYPSMISFITGPSRTGDIERILVLGAHGPKKLTIFCL